MDWFAHNQVELPRGIRVDVKRLGRRVASGTLPVLGYHNVLNAVAAIAAANCVGVDPQEAMEALGSFKGVQRRQEILGEEAGSS